MLGKREKARPARIRVIVVDAIESRAEMMQTALMGAGYEIAGRLSDPQNLLDHVARAQADVVVISVDVPSRHVLEQINAMTCQRPRPIVMFTDSDDAELIRDAVGSGVSSYVVAGLAANRIKPVIEVAIARFQQFQALRDELIEAKSDLTRRKLIDRAKGILMQRGMSEEQAYCAMRKMAMDQNKRIADVAQSVLSVADLLGSA